MTVNTHIIFWPYIVIKVGGLKHFALIDSGSDFNVLSSDVWSDFSNVSFQRSESDRKYIVTANNDKSRINLHAVCTY